MDPSLNHSTPKKSDRREQSKIENNQNDLQIRTITLIIPNSNKENDKVEVTLSTLGSIGQVIKFLRKALGFSQEKLASTIPDEKGVGRPYLSRIESGTASNPTLSAIRTIAEALYIEIEALIFLGLDTSNKALTELELVINVKEQLLNTWIRGIEEKMSSGDSQMNKSPKTNGASIKKKLNQAVGA